MTLPFHKQYELLLDRVYGTKLKISQGKIDKVKGKQIVDKANRQLKMIERGCRLKTKKKK